MSPKSKRRLRFDNFVYENSTSFVSDDEGFSRDKDGYGGTIGLKYFSAALYVSHGINFFSKERVC